jgi:hypothetical protein
MARIILSCCTPPSEEQLFLNGGGLRSEEKVMASIDDFRFESHQLLLELDAATMGMMQLVSSKCVSGPNWDAAIKRQHDAYERWDTFIGVPAVEASQNTPPVG